MYVCDRLKNKVVELELENTKIKKKNAELLKKEQKSENTVTKLKEMHDQILDLQSKMKEDGFLERKLNTCENDLRDSRERLKA